MTITKAELADTLCTDMGFSKNDAKVLIDNFFDEIAQSLENGEEVKIPGLGNFIVRDKTARPGRNPKTGEPATIAARRVVTFKSGRKLRDLLTEEDDA